MRLAVAVTVIASLAGTAVAQDVAPDVAQDVAPDAAPEAAPPAPDGAPGASADAAPGAASDAAPDAAPGAASDTGNEGGARAADKGTIGVGIILGEPTGITAKLYLSDDQAIQGAAGFAFIGGGLHIHGDYVFHPYILQSRDSFVLATYVGPGVRLIDYASGRDDNFFALGLRAVGGLLFDFTTVPLDAFVEIAGVLEFGFQDGEGVGFALNAAAGARYYF